MELEAELRERCSDDVRVTVSPSSLRPHVLARSSARSVTFEEAPASGATGESFFSKASASSSVMPLLEASGVWSMGDPTDAHEPSFRRRSTGMSSLAQFSELFLCAEHMSQLLSGFVDGHGGEAVLHAFRNLLLLEKSSATLILISSKNNFKHALANGLLSLDPVDEGFRTSQFAGLNVQEDAFTERLKEFARHYDGDRDPEGHSADGAILVTKSGHVVGAAVKVFTRERSLRTMRNVGTRHSAAVDSIAALMKSREEQGGRQGDDARGDAALVLSEAGTITVILGCDATAYRCCKFGPSACASCSQAPVPVHSFQ